GVYGLRCLRSRTLALRSRRSLRRCCRGHRRGAGVGMMERLRPGARRFFAQLGVSTPLMLAGMGGIAGPELVAAVSNAGGVGILGLYRAPPDRIAGLVAETERLTDHVNGLNWVPEVLDETALMERVEVGLEVCRPSTFVSFFGAPPAS